MPGALQWRTLFILCRSSIRHKQAITRLPKNVVALLFFCIQSLNCPEWNNNMKNVRCLENTSKRTHHKCLYWFQFRRKLKILAWKSRCMATEYVVQTHFQQEKSYWKSMMEQFNSKYSKYFESSYRSQCQWTSISTTDSHSKTVVKECLLVNM